MSRRPLSPRARLRRLERRVVTLRGRYLAGLRALRMAAWVVRQEARACSATTGGNSASGSTAKNSANRLASP
jgi:hypothetical protein